jgi:hypothetical protein
VLVRRQTHLARTHTRTSPEKQKGNMISFLKEDRKSEYE